MGIPNHSQDKVGNLKMIEIYWLIVLFLCVFVVIGFVAGNSMDNEKVRIEYIEVASSCKEELKPEWGILNE